MTSTRYVALGAALWLGATALAGAQGQNVAGCDALRNTVFPAGFVTSARVVPAEGDVPRYCEVRAMALPQIQIEVRLPMDGWNGKLYQTGCGGLCGVLGRDEAGPYWVNNMVPGLRRGYATASTDTGHVGTSIVDASWADRNPQAERDFGWRSIGETNRVANALIDAFYGRGAERAYYQGCSTGGRMANKAALQYPEMFDGIISGAPALDYPGLVTMKFAWMVQANTDEQGKPILGPGKDRLIGDEVMKQCDAADGTEDGLIEDPRKCEVDLPVLQCGAEGAGEQCLSEAELGVIEKWRQGPRNAAGEQLYPGGIPEGSEPFWALWLTGKPDGGRAFLPLIAEPFGAYLSFPEDRPSYKPTDFDFETDPANLAAMRQVLNADTPDLSAFVGAGGKMIVWHGWADAVVTPYKTVEWYEELAAASGGEEALAEHVRLFMIPGMDHCGIQPGPGGIDQSKLDLLTKLERWVENGTPPETIMADQ
jgi:pimeloyl-ACP methyl ester carboxylesterase